MNRRWRYGIFLPRLVAIWALFLHVRNMIQDTALEQLLQMLSRGWRRRTNVLPGGHFLLMPWSHISGLSWQSSSHPNGSSAGHLGEITLYPAPGEELDLDILVLDELLTMTTRHLNVQVRY